MYLTQPKNKISAAMARRPNHANIVSHRYDTAWAMAGTRRSSRKCSTQAAIFCWTASNGYRLHVPGCAKCAGKIKNASTSDIVNTNITTMATSLIICPMKPVTNVSEPKATMVVSTPTKTGASTPLTPFTDASVPTRPISRSAAMFSPTTTASSTTTPMTMMRPKREIMLRLTSNAPKKRNAPKNEIGTPIATQIASRRSNISTRKRNTSTNPSKPFFMRRLMRDSINSD